MLKKWDSLIVVIYLVIKYKYNSINILNIYNLLILFINFNFIKTRESSILTIIK